MVRGKAPGLPVALAAAANLTIDRPGPSCSPSTAELLRPGGSRPAPSSRLRPLDVERWQGPQHRRRNRHGREVEVDQAGAAEPPLVERSAPLC